MLTQAAVGAAIGLVLGWMGVRWLGRRPYVIEDDPSTARFSVTWVLVVLPILDALLMMAWWSVAPLYAVLLLGYSAALAVLAAIDLDVHRLPNKITLPLIPITAGWLLLTALVSGEPQRLVAAALGGLALSAFYLLQYLVSRGRGMGLGDVKLAASMGMVLAYRSWEQLLAATVVTYLAAFLFGVALVIFKRGGRRTEIAFGPHMVLGAIGIMVVPGLLIVVRALQAT